MDRTIKKISFFFHSQGLQILFGILCLLSLILPPCGFGGQVTQDQKTTDIVLSIVDGDTLWIEHNGFYESIRLIGIDTPESRINPKAIKDAERSKEDIKIMIKLGKEATQYVRSLVKPGDAIQIEFDKQTRDKYRRLLAYVFLADGKMLNEEIVKAGYANLMTYPPNLKYQERFLKAYQNARENNRGLWGKN
jgi:micrococcal nuclease